MVGEICIEQYDVQYRSIWDEFVADSKNGTFLFLRDYMEYHADRFKDHSLLFFNPVGKLVALMPANLEGDGLVSHGGLTYGGVISGKNMRASLMLDIFETLKDYLIKININHVVYKLVPYIYHDVPAAEDQYALFIHKATLFRRDISTTIDLKNQIEYSERRKRGIKKANKIGFIAKQSNDFRKYMDLVATNLEMKYGVRPVHSPEEMMRLADQFPNNIKLYVTEDKTNEIVAGVIIYETKTVAHVQYIASSQFGRENSALDILFYHLINYYKEIKRYFDFGISTEKGGEFLNTGLIEQKEGFGGRAITYDFYRWDINL